MLVICVGVNGSARQQKHLSATPKDDGSEHRSLYEATEKSANYLSSATVERCCGSKMEE